jgi:very-short-patch-repair endonuclease
MDVVHALQTLGGVSSMRELVAATSRRRVRRALADGLIERAGRSLVLPALDAHARAAADLTGVRSHLSAAQAWGWKVKNPPDKAWVSVGRHRKLTALQRRRHHVVYAELGAGEVVEGITSPLRTALDCARRLPFDEALAVADSALRSGLVEPEELVRAAERLKGRGRPQCVRVARAATALAANPFESVLRALLMEFEMFQVEPQGEVVTRSLVLHPDLVDRRHRIVFEADSFEFHTTKVAHDLDCERFTALAVAGWMVIRFSWEQVMLRPDYVRSVLAELAAALEGGHSDWHHAAVPTSVAIA